jgi:hypothetical protein
VQDTLIRAHLTTLACALAQGEDGLTKYTELDDAGPTRLETAGAPAAAPDSSKPFVSPYPVPATTVVQQYIERLSIARVPQERVALVRMIANSADTVPDLDLATGQKLAEYLLQARPDEDEQRQLLQFVPRLGHWNALRLGLADQLATASGRESQRQEVLRAVLSEEVTLSSPENRLEVRRRLLQSVRGTLSDEAGGETEKWQALDVGRQALRDLYATQAQLLNVPADAYAARPTPADVLSALVTHVAGQLDSAKLSPAEQRVLANLPSQLRAVDFLAETDLQRTVLLQRLWLRVLSAQLSQRLPAKTLAARNIVEDTLTAATAAPRVFEQARDLETGLLRLWLLYRPADEAALSPGKEA